MFLKFESTEEIRAYGGSCFIEIQYCRVSPGTRTRKILSSNTASHWNLTSLYVFHDEIRNFYEEYKDILDNGLYGNMCEGVLDPWGMNYYDEEKASRIIEKLKMYKPTDFYVFLRWLNENPYHNGFYVLGI